jgi:cation diffusion facilitator CzcD-associated flavoprotein CzcO
MGAAIQLQRLGIESFVMFDRATDVGGTWHWNTYPGLAVDISSVTYSYSFEPNPYWSRMFAPGRELKAYACQVADKYQLRSKLRLGCEVERVVYDEARNLWTVHVAGQAPLTARIVIAATGYLSRPKRPNIPGIDAFAGKIIHTAAWDHDHSLEGRTAAVIGTGATAVQLLPEIAPQLNRLYVHQRTPIWVAPKRDARISPRVQKLFARWPFTQRLLRWFDSFVLELMVWFGVLYYRREPRFAKAAENLCRKNIEWSIKDPELRRKLTPTYSFGCKRPTVSNKYYRVFTRSNVELVTESIERIEPDAIVTTDGQRRAIDTLILATGYHVWGSEGLMPVIGRDGLELGRYWLDNGYQAYEGISIPGFPNLFYLPSPYSYTGLSYFWTIEGQMKHIARCVGAMQERGATRIEVDPAKTDAFVERMRRHLRDSVFVQAHCTPANSYYFDPHGEPSLLRPTPVLRAHYEHAHFEIDDYRFA